MRLTLGMLQREDGTTILVNEEGELQTVELRLRPSTSSPSRIKAQLAVPIDDNRCAPLPFAESHFGAPGYATDFRLEMN